ncbi:hypothetical protein [Vibrio aquimaris]|uniref:Uncharacterized protein n=1 Tax=Vibrio aquimaris TaxID=2587862 RepID=A0A5P9CPR8_9VIBR|nr:hypothetical protein [Vibrio aquimaris]QFT28248.1 hypothetical protein FIV01_17800 [Vibrio aquimaris]
MYINEQSTPLVSHRSYPDYHPRVRLDKASLLGVVEEHSDLYRVALGRINRLQPRPFPTHRFNEKEPQSVIRQLAAIANTLYLVSVEVDKFDHKGTMAPPSPKNDYVYFVELRNFIGIAIQNLNSRLYQYSSEYSAYVRYILRNDGRDKILYNIYLSALRFIIYQASQDTSLSLQQRREATSSLTFFSGGPQARLMQGRQVNTFALPEARGRNSGLWFDIESATPYNFYEYRRRLPTTKGGPYTIDLLASNMLNALRESERRRPSNDLDAYIHYLTYLAEQGKKVDIGVKAEPVPYKLQVTFADSDFAQYLRSFSNPIAKLASFSSLVRSNQRGDSIFEAEQSAAQASTKGAVADQVMTGLLQLLPGGQRLAGLQQLAGQIADSIESGAPPDMPIDPRIFAGGPSPSATGRESGSTASGTRPAYRPTAGSESGVGSRPNNENMGDGAVSLPDTLTEGRAEEVVSEPETFTLNVFGEGNGEETMAPVIEDESLQGGATSEAEESGYGIDRDERVPQTVEEYRSAVRNINFRENFNQKLMKFSEKFDQFYSHTKDNGILQFVDKEELIDKFFEDSLLSSEPPYPTREAAKTYIETTKSLGFTSQNLPGNPIYAFDGPGGEHFARHEVMHLLSAEGGMTAIANTSPNLNEALTEVMTRIVEDVLVLNDEATLSARENAYPALAELVLGVVNSDENIMVGLFEGYIKDRGLDELVEPMVTRWRERSERDQIQKRTHRYPARNQNQLMTRLFTDLAGNLGGATSLEQASEDLGTKSQIDKMKSYLGF